MKYRTDYYILNVLVVAREFDGRTEEQKSRDYYDLRDMIRAEARDEVNALNDLGLALTGFDELGFYWPPRLKPCEIEIDEKLINHGVSWTDPSLTAGR